MVLYTPRKKRGTSLKCYRVLLKTHYRIKKTLFTLKISYAFFSFTSSNPLWVLYVEAIALYTQLLYLHQLNVTPYNNGASCFTPPITEKSSLFLSLSVSRSPPLLPFRISLSVLSSTEALKQDSYTHSLSLSLSCRLVNNTSQSEYRCCWRQPIGSVNVAGPQPR